MTRRFLFSAGAAAALALAGALGLDLPAAGQDAAPPTLFELTDVNVFDVKDFTTELVARVHECYRYRGRSYGGGEYGSPSRCIDVTRPVGRAVVEIGLDPPRRGVFNVRSLSVAASAYVPRASGYGLDQGASSETADGPEFVDSLREGARAKARFTVRRGLTRNLGYGRRIPTTTATFRVRARLDARTRLDLNGLRRAYTDGESAYAHRDHLAVGFLHGRSTLRRGIVPRAFDPPDDAGGSTPRTRPLKRVELAGGLPIPGGETLRFTAAWDTPTRGTVTFTSPSTYAGKAGTILARSGGRYLIRGERGSGIRIRVDSRNGAGTLDLGFGRFRVPVASFVIDGGIAFPPESAGPGDPEASYLTDRTVLPPGDFVSVFMWHSGYRADYVVLRDGGSEGLALWIVDTRPPPNGQGIDLHVLRVSADADLTPRRIDEWYHVLVPGPVTFDEAIAALDDRYLNQHELRGSSTIRRSGGRLVGDVSEVDDFAPLRIRFDMADPLGGE